MPHCERDTEASLCLCQSSETSKTLPSLICRLHLCGPPLVSGTLVRRQTESKWAYRPDRAPPSARGTSLTMRTARKHVCFLLVKSSYSSLTISSHAETASCADWLHGGAACLCGWKGFIPGFSFSQRPINKTQIISVEATLSEARAPPQTLAHKHL